MVDIAGRMTGEDGKNDEKIKIKRLPAERWQEFMEIRLIGLETDPLAFMSSLQEEERYPESRWKERITNQIFAETDFTIVGLIGFLIRTRQKERHVADIFGFYVRKEYRGKGIGDRLLKAAIHSISSSVGVRKIELGVIANQKAAITLYERNGFSRVGKLSMELFLDGEFFDEILMEKLI